ncbi:TIGR02757 family protein [Cyclobacterium jeungdonense]|uniref:TIGR02757 family protein n=1 Tax=Cyclobacterium jeungdonense TaxID=708087 RepID=A0ABT8C392_9BACT|nr:TIGR02757 family protein [Cyclobacterium jeungdonense]MDN3686781.1 TIGR02757 family protein [Cyclobacterium jeungdonense]
MKDLKAFLDEKVSLYNRPDFIEDDPISVPHRFGKKQDIEISGFFAATLAWGQRKTIINKSLELMAMMDNSPHDFLCHHEPNDLKPFLKFKHRTFNDLDTLYFIDFLSRHYREHESLETAFIQGLTGEVDIMERLLSNFHELFFEASHAPHRTRKHVATPKRKAACKRINMFLRWMVRKDDRGVDFGIWNSLSPAQLICPCDLHVDRVGRSLGLIQRKATDWQTAMELTRNLRKFDPKDPVKYDFALFGMGVMEKNKK